MDFQRFRAMPEHTVEAQEDRFLPLFASWFFSLRSFYSHSPTSWCHCIRKVIGFKPNSVRHSLFIGCLDSFRHLLRHGFFVFVQLKTQTNCATVAMEQTRHGRCLLGNDEASGCGLSPRLVLHSCINFSILQSSHSSLFAKDKRLFFASVCLLFLFFHLTLFWRRSFAEMNHSSCIGNVSSSRDFIFLSRSLLILLSLLLFSTSISHDLVHPIRSFAQFMASTISCLVFWNKLAGSAYTVTGSDIPNKR